MIKIIVLLSVYLMCGCVYPAKNNQSNNSQVEDVIVEHVNVITMKDTNILFDRAVVVNQGKIVKILMQKDANKIKAKQRIDGKNRYLMPGLADMHVHVRWDPQKMFNLFLANGVTTVANMWLKDGGYDHLALRNKINNKEMLGPRYLVSGLHLEGDFPASLQEVDRLLDDHVARKIDFVKVHGDLSPEIYNTIITGAKKRGLKVVGHAQHKMPLKNSLVLNSLEHIEEFLYTAPDELTAKQLADDFLPTYRKNVQKLMDKDYRKKIVDEVAASGIYLDPTLIVYKMVGVWQSDEHLAELKHDPDLSYLSAEVRDFWLSPATNPYQEEGFPITKSEVDKNLQVMLLLTKEFHDRGVPLLSGTDTFGTLVPGISLQDELQLLVDAGLSPFEALRCSTVNVAAYLGESKNAGTIEVGKRADFILLDKNPLSDIHNSRSVEGVFIQGQWLTRDSLLKDWD